MRKQYFVYILASETRVLYIGVTGDLRRRISEHRAGEIDGFTAEYKVCRLVHIERFGLVEDAIAREKQLKGWSRAKKISLICRENPDFLDLQV